MLDPTSAAPVAGVASVGVLAAGYYLVSRERAAWIPGYDPATSAIPEAELARHVGKRVLEVGVALGVLGIVLALGYGPTVVGTGIVLWVVATVLYRAYKVRELVACYDCAPSTATPSSE